VGAALEADDGRVFTGCNVENASYGGTICAERTAVVGAVAAGQQRFRRIVITSDAEQPVAPCGFCRQFMAEFGTNLEVISIGAGGGRQTWTLAQLLPHAFTGADFRENA
jgi:cytidine deaminase